MALTKEEQQIMDMIKARVAAGEDIFDVIQEHIFDRYTDAYNEDELKQ